MCCNCWPMGQENKTMASSDGGASRLGRAEPPAGRHASETTADLAQSFFSTDPSPGPPRSAQADPLGRLLAAIDPVSDSAMTYFYGHLFAIEPQIRAMFPPAMDAQRKRFYQALTHLIASSENPGELTSYLEGLGRAHRK